MASEPTHIYVDADACPVKDEVARVAGRHDLGVSFVANAWMRLPDGDLFKRVIVADGPDAADNWIAERAGPEDIVITADIPLAARCVPAGATVLNHNGKPFNQNNIGMTLATRNLMAHLRETGAATTYNASFSKQDRSRFLEALETAVQAIKRRG
jgi:uncharacterized protein YaiI (UPF0178 family)